LRLEGWSRQRRIVMLLRRLERSVALAERDDVGQLWLSFAEVELARSPRDSPKAVRIRLAW
jgi:hypothetical protein